MRNKFAIGTLSLMVFIGAAVIVWGQDSPPQGPGGGPQQHEWRPGPGFQGRERRGGWEGGRGMHGHRGGMGFHGGMMGGGLMRLAENPRVRQYLGLTDDQVSRLRQISTQAEITAVQTRAQMEVNHIQLRQLMQADNPDENAIMSKLDETNALRGKMEKQRVQTLFQARSVLTADQIQKIKTFRENGGAGMQRGPGIERRGPGGWQQHRQGGAPGAPNTNTNPPAPPAQPQP